MGFSDIIAAAFQGIPMNAVLKERIALAEEKLAVLDREFAKLKLEKERLESENKTLRFDLQQRAAQLQSLKPTEPPGDKCPYCNRTTGKLEDIKPHPDSDWAFLGYKKHLYKCKNPDCEKNYEREVQD
jgi:hypothetical protein